jgi:hypothetical protein
MCLSKADLYKGVIENIRAVLASVALKLGTTPNLRCSFWEYPLIDRVVCASAVEVCSSALEVLVAVDEAIAMISPS